MDRWFFIEVQTYRSVNKMGLELGEYVYERYDQSVVHQDCMSDIAADIQAKMEELQEKYPRCREFLFEHRGYTDKYGVTTDDISVKPNSQFNDNYVFILNTKYIRKLNLETSLLF